MSVTRLAILGSTGSIGRNTLDVVRRHPERFAVHAVAARRDVERLAEQIEAFAPPLAVLYDPDAAERLRAANPRPGTTTVLSGMAGLEQAASDEAVELVVSGIVGSVGLRPTYTAIDRGKRVAVANKETLVLAGELMVNRAAQTGSRLLPMDSEHNAIFQCLAGETERALRRIVLTASGGPFRDWPLERFPEITREQALDHPNWKMGPKITIDSATMMNKGLEVIEARWLFGLPPERIEVLIHRQSIVHSLVEFVDGSVIAQLGLPDMRTPIAHCLAWPERLPLDLPRLNLAEVGRLEFQEVTREKYPCLYLALEALALGGGAPAALNGANEEVVAAYLDTGFPFPQIGSILEEVMRHLARVVAADDAPACLKRVTDVEAALAADRWGRETARTLIPRTPEAHSLAAHPSEA